jgi:hypothetical protein
MSRSNLILDGQLRREILKFDLDAFITAAIEHHPFKRGARISKIFAIWMLTMTVRMVILPRRIIADLKV